jgi:hypothetical protein
MPMVVVDRVAGSEAASSARCSSPHRVASAKPRVARSGDRGEASTQSKLIVPDRQTQIGHGITRARQPEAAI